MLTSRIVFVLIVFISSASIADTTIPPDLTAEEKHTYEVIYQLRQPVFRVDAWTGLMKELCEIGKPAVPIMAAELETSKKGHVVTAIAFCLRVISDTRAVPSLLPAMLNSRESTYESDIRVRDPKLAAFMKEHQYSPKDKDMNRPMFGNATGELMAAVEALTDHIEVHPSRQMPFDEFKMNWSQWWDENKQTFEDESSIAEMQKARSRVELANQLGVAKFGPRFPVGDHIRLTPAVEVTLFQEYGSTRELTTHVDFDSGKTYVMNEGAELTGQPNYWNEDAGIDGTCQVTELRNKKRYAAFSPRNTLCWPVSDERFESLENELRAGWRLEIEDIDPVAFIEQPILDGPKNARVYGATHGTFLFVTDQGARGILNVIGPNAENTAVTIRYRLVAGTEGKLSPVAIAIRDAKPVADDRVFGAEHLVEIGADEVFDFASETKKKVDRKLLTPSTSEEYQSLLTGDFDVYPSMNRNGTPGDLTFKLDSNASPFSNDAWDVFTVGKADILLKRQWYGNDDDHPSKFRLFGFGDGKTYDHICVIRTVEGKIGLVQMLKPEAGKLRFRYRLAMNKQ